MQRFGTVTENLLESSELFPTPCFAFTGSTATLKGSNSPTSGLSPLAAVPAYSAEFVWKKSAYSSKAMAKTHRKHCFQCIFGAYNLEIGFLRGFFKKSQFSFLFLPKLLKYPVDFVRNWTKSSYPLKKPKKCTKNNEKIGFFREKAAKSQFVTRKQAGGRRRTEPPAQSRPPGATARNRLRRTTRPEPPARSRLQRGATLYLYDFRRPIFHIPNIGNKIFIEKRVVGD